MPERIPYPIPEFKWHVPIPIHVSVSISGQKMTANCCRRPLNSKNQTEIHRAAPRTASCRNLWPAHLYETDTHNRLQMWRAGGVGGKLAKSNFRAQAVPGCAKLSKLPFIFRPPSLSLLYIFMLIPHSLCLSLQTTNSFATVVYNGSSNWKIAHVTCSCVTRWRNWFAHCRSRNFRISWIRCHRIYWIYWMLAVSQR